MAAPKGNKFALGNTGGRPPQYDSPEKLMDQINAYFHYCEGESHEEEIEVTSDKGEKSKKKITVWDREPERPVWTGLALFLGFASRKALNDYAQKEEFSYPIARALMVIESEYEELLPHTKGPGVSFALKNFGWVDKFEFTGKDGKDLIPAALDRLTPAQLEQLHQLQQQVTGE